MSLFPSFRLWESIYVSALAAQPVSTALADKLLITFQAGSLLLSQTRPCLLDGHPVFFGCSPGDSP